MAENTSTVLGVDVATVNLKDGGTVLISRGQDIPKNVTNEEKARLKSLSVFDEPVKAKPAPPVVVDPRIAELEAALAEEKARADAAVKASAEKNPAEKTAEETDPAGSTTPSS
jgi:hypothetical protein